MRDFGKVLLYVLLVLAIGVVLSPPVYWICQWLIAQGHLEFLRGFPFHRYFTRTLQVAALVLLIPFVLWLRIRHPSQLGIQPNPLWWRDLLAGLIVGLVPMAALAAGYLFFDIYGMRGEPAWDRLWRVAGTAAVVSLLEEIFFRGVILGLCVRAFGSWFGAFLSALVFASVHFVRPAKIADSGPVTWSSGWEQLMLFTAGVPPMPLLAYGMATLVLAGLLLAAATLRTRSLWAAFGLHAGWIFAQQGFLSVARYRVNPELSLLPWVGPNLVSGAVPTGIVPAGMLLLSFWMLWWFVRRR